MPIRLKMNSSMEGDHICAVTVEIAEYTDHKTGTPSETTLAQGTSYWKRTVTEPDPGTGFKKIVIENASVHRAAEIALEKLRALVTRAEHAVGLL